MTTAYIYYLGLLAILSGTPQETPSPAPQEQTITTDSLSATTDLAQKFFNPDKMLRQSVETIYQNMSPEQRASQMIMVASTTGGSDYRNALELIDTEKAGGVLLLKGSKADFRKQVLAFNKLKKKDNLQPLYACDCEPSLLKNKWSDATPVMPASDQTHDTVVTQQTRKIATQMKEVGAVLNFAPVVDIAANKSIINNRSFGDNPTDIVARSVAFINALQAEGIAATAKHFPGHGAVRGDSHKSSVYINGPLTELETFRQVIDRSKPVVVMIGHITIRGNNNYNTRGLPASLSRTVSTGLLRDELGYDGIITTDAMNMKAVSRYKNADWRAVEAGADLIIMPMEPENLHRQILTALEKGDATSRQLEQSIKRIIKLKLITGETLPAESEIAEAVQ